MGDSKIAKSASSNNLPPMNFEKSPSGRIENTILDDSQRFTTKYINTFSPRSKEAMRIFGVIPSDIIYKDRHAFVLELKEDEFEKIADIRFDYDVKVKGDFI